MQEAKVVAIGEPHPKENPLKQLAKDWISPLINELEKYHIPEDKMEAVIEFTVNFFARHYRTMKTPRMLRKIVEEFKLKPLPKTESDASDQTSGS